MSVAKKQGDKVASRKQSKPRGTPAWGGFIEVVLNQQHVDALDALDLVAEYPYSSLEAIVKDGYKVSFGTDLHGGGFRVTLMDIDHASPTAGKALAGRGSTMHDAFASVLFKHLVVLGDGWETFAGGQESPRFG